MTNGQRIIAVACLAEAGTGLGLIAAPWLVVGLLMGVQPEGVAIVISRVAGIALIALAIACWPGPSGRENAKPYLAMLVYNALVALVLAKVGLDAEMSGFLLWPVAILHILLSVLLAWAWSRLKRTSGTAE
jgi:hypothetical protein